MQSKIDAGIVTFREDHTEPPFRKTHLRPVAEETDDATSEEDGLDIADQSEQETELAAMVRGTYFYKQAQVSVKYLRELMGAKVFDNPKDHEELARLFRYVASDEPKPIIMDFFAGSGSTAEAVIRLAANGMAEAKFIAIQFPEPVNPKERTGKAALAKGWKTISEVTRERLRRVLKQPDLQSIPQGFRAFRLAETGILRWNGANSIEPEDYLKQMDAFADTLKPGWKAEDLIWEVALREGLALTSRVVSVEGEKPGKLWRVTDDEQGKAFIICLADAIDLPDLKGLGLTKDDLFICRDTALTDTVAANLALQCRLKVL
ncbi:hypothetical protein [Brucella oryzae]|nr:hypothetical protein [Brucella oryzae]